MKIILTQDVEKLGASGSLQDVKPGFARNYLIPKGFAVPATTGRIREYQVQQAAEQRRVARQEQEMQSLADRINGMRLTFVTRAGEQGRLYGSVTSGDIAEQLSKELGEEIDRRKVDLPQGIHELGEFPVTINLVGRLKPQITAVVQPVKEEVPEATTEPEAAPEEEAPAEEETEAEDQQ